MSVQKYYARKTLSYSDFTYSSLHSDFYLRVFPYILTPIRCFRRLKYGLIPHVTAVHDVLSAHRQNILQ